MITAICCVVRLRLTRFKDKVSYVAHIVDISVFKQKFYITCWRKYFEIQVLLSYNTLHHLLLHIVETQLYVS